MYLFYYFSFYKQKVLHHAIDLGLAIAHECVCIHFTLYSAMAWTCIFNPILVWQASLEKDQTCQA